MECAESADAWLRAGIAHHLAGQFGAAVEQYAKVIAIQPQHAQGWRLLGIVAWQSGDVVAARRLLERALRIAPDDVAALGALGAVSEAEGNVEAAYAAYTASGARGAWTVAALAGLLRTAATLERGTEVRAVADAAFEQGMGDLDLARAIGAVRLQVGDFVGAVAALEIAVVGEPRADALANLGAAYVHLNRIDAAIWACSAALERDPMHVGAAINLGIAHKAADELPAALAAFTRAVDAGSDEAHMSLGTNLLLDGDYHAGWPHYGWVTAERRRSSPFAALPMWDGAPAPGKRLLIWPEQGIGDTFQFVRFLDRARSLTGPITLVCPAGTIDVLKTVSGVDVCVEMGAVLEPDHFDLWLPTVRLPVVFDVTVDTLTTRPYLRADPIRVERFAPRLGRAGQGLRIGLVWSGNPHFEWNDIRSCGVTPLDVLADVCNVKWFALQQGAPRADAARSRIDLLPINDEVADFADTAAIITQLDLVITVDTSVAHLAGALGCPAWVLLCNRPDWRWQRRGACSPWYPTLRLFRQTDAGAWGPVIDELRRELVLLAQNAQRRLVSDQ